MNFGLIFAALVEFQSVTKTLSPGEVAALTNSAGTTPVILVEAVPNRSIIPVLFQVVKTSGPVYTLIGDPDLTPCGANLGVWGPLESVGVLDQPALRTRIRSYSLNVGLDITDDIGNPLALCVDAGSLSAGSNVQVVLHYILLP